MTGVSYSRFLMVVKMKDKRKKPLKIALHCMDERTYKIMEMYLQGACNGAATVVEDRNAEVDIVNADSVKAKKLLEQRVAEAARPIIALSLQDLTAENILYVRKPIKTVDLLSALSKAGALLLSKEKSSHLISSHTNNAIAPKPQDLTTLPQEQQDLTTLDLTTLHPEKDLLKKQATDTDKQKQISKHQTAMLIDEGKFNEYIGFVPGLDVNDPKQFLNAAYNIKDYFQGYVQSALTIAKAKKQVMQLNSGWKTLIIFPHNDEIWLNADDKQLRAFANVLMTKILIPGTVITVTPKESDVDLVKNDSNHIYSAEVFLWKLAVWTSKGRYSNVIDIHQPVFLKHWPNLTRLVVIPHALRISALLMKGARTLPDIAEILHIKPQYVFVFISAAYAIGLAGQARRDSDKTPSRAPAIKSKQHDVLSRIIGKLSNL